jgi:hypothetical protein
MTKLSTVEPDAKLGNSIDRLITERYVPVALRGLERSVVESGKWFCFAAKPAANAKSLKLEEISERYTTMSLLGLQRQAEFGRTADVPVDLLFDNLFRWSLAAPVLGDTGLVLWLAALRGDSRAQDLVATVLRRKDEVLRPGVGVPSMEVGCLLIGASEAVRLGLGSDALRTLADDVAEVLARNQDSATGLFAFANAVRRKNIFRSRVDSRLGSFASQVYPTMGFAAHSRATGDPRSARIARNCSDRICTLQGDAGQWWWIYNTSKGDAAVRYPVYSVHQDAMGPMMLTATELGAGYDPRFDVAIEKSFAWFDRRPELPGENLIDEERGMIWRAIQHDDPATTHRLGLSSAEISRLSRSAWFGVLDTRVIQGNGGYVCRECRPYHLGWVLLAQAMYADCLAKRARVGSAN